MQKAEVTYAPPQLTVRPRTRIHYIRYGFLRCAKCKNDVTVNEVGQPSRCCDSFIECYQK